MNTLLNVSAIKPMPEQSVERRKFISQVEWNHIKEMFSGECAEIDGCAVFKGMRFEILTLMEIARRTK